MHFVSTIEKTLAEEVTKLFWVNIWKLHKLPESIITDRETQFVVEIIRELNQMLGDWYQIVNSLPSTNRQSDRKNKLRTRTILENIHWLSSGAMARLVSNGRVCI